MKNEISGRRGGGRGVLPQESSTARQSTVLRGCSTWLDLQTNKNTIKRYRRTERAKK